MTQAVVLAGGGALGAYAVGVMEALFSGRWMHGNQGAVDPSVLVGTSVGAYNGAFIASRVGATSLDAVRALRELWVHRIAEYRDGPANGVFRFRGHPGGYLNIRGKRADRLRNLLREIPHDTVTLMQNWLRRSLDLAASDEAILRRILRFFDVDDVVSHTPLARLVRDTIDFRSVLHPQARSLKIITTEWDTGKAFIFHNHAAPRVGPSQAKPHRHVALTEANTHNAILASTAIPGIMSPIWIDDQVFVDGGVTMNLPLRPAIEAGATDIHIIHLEAHLKPIPYGRATSAFEALERLMTALPVSAVESDLQYAGLIRRSIEVARALKERFPPSALGHDDPIQRFIDSFANAPRLTVHRHFPSRAAGGAMDLLDFRLHSVMSHIELGFEETIGHDCRLNGCIL